VIEYLKRDEASPFPPDLVLQTQGVVSKTDRGELHGDLYWSQSEDIGWVIVYDSRFGHWAYVSVFDFDVDGCCEEVAGKIRG